MTTIRGLLKARHAGEAIEVCRDFERDLQLLLTDVIMPGGMSGKDLAKRLLDKNPSLRVPYMSGYTGDAIAHHGVLDDGVQFQPKPFTVESLSRKVREVLDS